MPKRIQVDMALNRIFNIYLRPTSKSNVFCDILKVTVNLLQLSHHVQYSRSTYLIMKAALLLFLVGFLLSVFASLRQCDVSVCEGSASSDASGLGAGRGSAALAFSTAAEAAALGVRRGTGAAAATTLGSSVLAFAAAALTAAMWAAAFGGCCSA